MKAKKNDRRKVETIEREMYLNTDFGDVLSSAEPLKLDLEFPSPTQSISIRLPREVLYKIKRIANEQDVPYQSLIKLWLIEKLKRAA